MTSGLVEYDRDSTLIHGKASTYNEGCHCPDCRRAHRYANAERSGMTPEPESWDHPWLVIDLPIAVIARQAFTDAEAIAAVAALP